MKNLLSQRSRGNRPSGAGASLSASASLSLNVSVGRGNQAEQEDAQVEQNQELEEELTPTLDALENVAVATEDDGPPEDFDLGSELNAAVNSNQEVLPEPEGDLSDVEMNEAAVEANVDAPANLPTELPQLPNVAVPNVDGPTPNVEGPIPETGHTMDLPNCKVESPDANAAFEDFVMEGMELSDRITDRYMDVRSDIIGSSDQAISEVQGAAEGLRDAALSGVQGARAEVEGLAEGARTRARESKASQLEELRSVNEQAMQRVLDRSHAHQEEIQGKVDELASNARGLGSEGAASILQISEAQAQSVLDHGQAIAGRYADHRYSRDIRVTSGRMAREAAAEIRSEGRKAADALREAAEGLAVKIEADGAEYIANLAENDEPTREFFESLLSEAEQALDSGIDEFIEELEQTEQQLLEQLDGMESGFLASIDEAETTQVEAIDRLRNQILEGLSEARHKAMWALEDKLREVEEWMDEHQDLPPELIVAYLQECSLSFSAAVDTLDEELKAMGIQGQTSLSNAADSAVGAFEATRSDVDEKLDEFSRDANQAFESLVEGYEEGLADEVEQFSEAWNAEADDKIETLDAARDEAITGLTDTYAQGETELAEQRASAEQGLRQTGADSRKSISDKARELANRSRWSFFRGLVGSFLSGMFSGLLSVLKNIGIALLIAAAVILVVAVVIALAKGIAIAAAIGAAIAAVVAVAKALAVVGLVLAGLSTLNSLIQFAAAWMNPELTWNEVAEQGGDSFINIVADWVPVIFFSKVKNPTGALRTADTVNELVTVGNAVVVPMGYADAGEASARTVIARQNQQR
ncbi:MAG: hypothetical protein EA397_00915 [Deltaproteobacteria bacterium]|nr:MAG: hypothetical protein EA397_00915 [Deltaproteobacteria bacterium]